MSGNFTVPESGHPGKNDGWWKKAVHDNGGRIRRRSGERNGTEQVRWRGENTTDSIGVGTAGSDTCAAPG